MKKTSVKNEISKNNIMIYIKFTVIMFFIFVFSFLVLAYPSICAEGINNGIKLCFDKMISALFPFMVISSFFLKSGLSDFISVPFENFNYFLFRLPKEATPVIIMSLIGGYPVGANMVQELYCNKKISRQDGRHLLLFCVNPSISFVISYMGTFLYSNEKLGVIIYLSIILSSLISGIIIGHLKGETCNYKTEQSNYLKNIKISTAFTDSVKESSFSIMGICATVVVFSCIESLLSVFSLTGNMKIALSSLLEITNFTKNYFNIVSPSLICAIVSFGGLCVHFQIMPCLSKLKVKYTSFLYYKVLNALLAMAISNIILYIFPVDVSVSSDIRSYFTLTETGFPVSLALIFMALIVIITDTTIQKMKSKF